MKKKRFPYFFLIAAVLLIGIVGFINNRTPISEEEQQRMMQEMQNQNQPKVSNNDVNAEAQDMRSKMGKMNANVPPNANLSTQNTPKTPAESHPQGSQTPGQWYDEDSSSNSEQ